MPVLRSQSRSSTRLPLEVWTNIFSFLRRPVTPTKEGEPHCDISQQDLANCMRVNLTFNRAAAAILYDTIIIDKLDKFVIGLQGSARTGDNIATLSTTPNRLSPSKYQNLAFVRRISFEYHPELLQLGRLQQSKETKKTSKLIDNLLKRLHDALLVLGQCSTLIERQPDKRIQHISINRYRPQSGLDDGIPRSSDLDVDGALLELVKAMRPVSACLSGQGLGLAQFDGCTTLCAGDSTRMDGSLPAHGSSQRHDIRWIGHCDTSPTSLFALFALRIPSIDIISVRPDADELDAPDYATPVKTVYKSKERNTRKMIDRLKQPDMMGELPALLKRADAWQGTTVAFESLEDAIYDSMISGAPALVNVNDSHHADAEKSACQHRWTFFPPRSIVDDDDAVAEAESKLGSARISTSLPTKRHGRSNTMAECLATMTSVVILAKYRALCDVSAHQAAWSTRPFTELSRHISDLSEGRVELSIRPTSVPWRWSEDGGEQSDVQVDLCPCDCDRV